MNKFSKKDIIYLISSIILIAIDQLVKIQIKNNLQVGESINIIDNFFKLTYVQNKGAAFGILQDKKWFFLIVGSIMIISLIYMFLKSSDIISKISISMIISGAIGNIIDRLLHGYVIDMFDFHAIWSYVFNVADICVVVGIGLLSIQMIREK